MDGCQCRWRGAGIYIYTHGTGEGAAGGWTVTGVKVECEGPTPSRCTEREVWSDYGPGGGAQGAAPAGGSCRRVPGRPVPCASRRRVMVRRVRELPCVLCRWLARIRLDRVARVGCRRRVDLPA